MMLFIYGPSAIGKTTFLKSVQHSLSHSEGTDLVVVYADHCVEHHVIANNTSVLVREGKKWGGKRAEKEPMRNLDNMIGDDRTIWVVECMRYLNGLWPELIEAHQRNGGGLRIIVPCYTGEVGQYFRQQRCDVLGKDMSDYWLDLDNCFSESAYRMRSCEKHLEPVGIPCYIQYIDKERENWDNIDVVLRSWLMDEVEEWYKGAKELIMDPQTGKFHDVDEHTPSEWPRYSIGDVYELNGYEFEITRINASSLVLTPVVDKAKTGARKVMAELLAKPEGAK